jgi:hypothetical protein
VVGAGASSAADNTGQLVARVVGVLAGQSAGRTDTAEQQDDGDENESDNNQLACGRVTDAVVGPSALSGAHVFLDLVGTELVVDEAAEGNAVAEELERGDRVAEDHHGGDHEEDIFQYTAEGHDEAGGSADL